VYVATGAAESLFEKLDHLAPASSRVRALILLFALPLHRSRRTRRSYRNTTIYSLAFQGV
jgi:hypothetical protein